MIPFFNFSLKNVWFFSSFLYPKHVTSWLFVYSKNGQLVAVLIRRLEKSYFLSILHLSFCLYFHSASFTLILLFSISRTIFFDSSFCSFPSFSYFFLWVKWSTLKDRISHCQMAVLEICYHPIFNEFSSLQILNYFVLFFSCTYRIQILIYILL